MIELEIDVPPIRRLALQDFSYSRLSCFSDCELKYYYTYILKEPRVFGPAATLGNIIHQALEYTLESDIPINLYDLLQNYQAARPEYDPDIQIPDEMIAAGEEMLREFVDRHVGETFDIVNNGKELAFSVVIGNARFNGYIDLVLRNQQGGIHCIDWKSGKVEVAAKDVSDNLQLGLYALVLSYLFPEQDSIYAELYYLKTGRRKGHLFTADDLLAVKSKLIALTSEVLVKDDFKPTNVESKCWWCDFAKNGVCPTGSKRIQKGRKNSYF